MLHQRTAWEQWWLDALIAGGPAPAVETAGPTETWTLIDSSVLKVQLRPIVAKYTPSRSQPCNDTS